jgi:hypothetical protein
MNSKNQTRVVLKKPVKKVMAEDAIDSDPFILLVRLRSAIKSGDLLEAARLQQRLSALGIEVQSIESLIDWKVPKPKRVRPSPER